MAKSPKTVAKNDVYDGSDIVTLPYPECVRQRPALYIGNNDLYGMLVCIREIINNSVDEFLAGHCNHIRVHKKDQYTFAITDNGRGVPFDEIDGKNSLTRIFGTLHAGRNFVEKTVFSTGINGCGSSITNAMATSFEVTSIRGKDKGYIKFESGHEKELRVAKLKTVPKAPFDKSSTKVEFTIDPSVFSLEGEELTSEAVFNLVRETAYLNNGLSIEYIDDITGTKENLYYTDGVTEYLKDNVVSNPIIKEPISLGTDTVKDTKIEVAFSYDASFNSEKIASFCNTIKTSEGGTHVTGFKRALTQKIITHVTENRLCKEKVTNDDVYSGLNAVVSVFVFNPKYTSQTKQCLKNTEVMGHVVTYANRAIDEWLNTNPTEIKVIATKLDLVAKARIAQKRALESVKKESGSSLTMLSNIAKFSDCEEQMSGRTELFVVEGDSAGGTVTVGRDKAFQAVYKLKGKVLNTVGMDLHKARTNKEVDDFLSVLRCGAGKSLDMEKLKFSKIIALADADDDGKHIELLLLSMMHEYLRPIIEAGQFYIALSPLYKVSITGKPAQYLNTTKDLVKFTANQVSENYVFLDAETDKPITNSAAKVKAISAFMKYTKAVREYADKISISPTILENVFLANLDQLTGDIDLGDRIEISELGNDKLNFTGFYTDDETSSEYFVSCTMSEDTILDDLGALQDLLIDTLVVSVTDKKGEIVEAASRYDLFNKLLDSIKRTTRVSRLKGLGEINPDELWDTSLNPETRRLIRVELLENSEEIVNTFMGKSPDKRKEFLKEVFADAIKDYEEV